MSWTPEFEARKHLSRKDISPTAKLILVHIAALSWGAEGISQSRPQIAEALGLSERDVRYGVMALRDAGLVMVVKNVAEDGGNLPNTYKILGVGGEA